MEFTDDARRVAEDKIKAITGRIALTEKDRAEVEKELRSSIYARAEARAVEKGSTVVAVEDIEEVCKDERSPGDIATCYSRSYSSGLKRAGFWSRLAAYIIDIVVIALAVITAIVPFVLIAWLMESFSMKSIALLVILWISLVLVVLGITLFYLIILEGRFGKTIGKYMMGLMVLKTNGERIGYKEALIRNISKYFRTPLIIDVILMLLFFYKDRQRAFDRVADTMVVHLR